MSAKPDTESGSDTKQSLELYPTTDPALTAERLRALLRATSQIVWTADSSGSTVADSPSWREFTGQTYEQWKGMGWLDAVHPDDREASRAAWLQAVREQAVYRTEYRLRRRDGSYSTVLARAAPVRDATGSIVEWVGTNTDVSDARHTEARLREEIGINRTILALGVSFAHELEPERLVQLVTDEATRLIGAAYGAFFFNQKGADGNSYRLFTLSGADREVFQRFRQPRATPLFGTTFNGQGNVRLDDVRADPRFGAWGPQPRGHPKVVSYLAVPVVARSGEVLGGLFFGHPERGRFTPAHEQLVSGLAAQAAVALENARLYEALRQSESSARVAYGAAKQAERRKDEFLAMLGHELRNPLAPILTALQVLELKRSGKPADRELLVIERQVRHLIGLVDDLLDVSRITRGKIKLGRERTQLAGIVHRAVEMVSPLLEQRSHALELSVAPDLYVDADPMRLTQVVANLLSNAAKYTEPGGRVRVATRRLDGGVELRVQDNGVGIPADLLPHIFEMFTQADREPDRKPGGLGIGLTIVKSLVQLHGGEVEAHSEGAGRGSEFVVRLPESSGPLRKLSTPLLPAVRVGQQADGNRLLVVDDNEDAAQALAEALRLLGYDTRVAFDGPTALQVAQQFIPGVVVLDIGLPVMDGYELASRLRALPELHAVRLIAVTGYGQDEDRRRSAAAGIDLHLVKPIGLKELRAALGPAKAP